MSYAIETKKRKFERILESLTDGTGSQSRMSLNSRNNASTVSMVNDDASDASKRRRITPTNVSKSVSTSSLTGHYLPSSRPAFLERLETYRQVTKWHIPSTEPVNASAWTKRGWICVDTDTVFCGSCKERLTVDLDVENKASDGDEAQDAIEDCFSLSQDIYDGLVMRYQELVVIAHTESCPWRKRGCDSSIQRIEGLLNTSNAVAATKVRYEGLSSEAQNVPSVVPLPDINEEELKRLQLDDQINDSLNLDVLQLAVCGWQRKTDDVIECRNCFRSLGLWLYRGDQPAMEKLDVVESHLEYCPWRSSEAQDTEINVTRDSIQRKEKSPGWELVCQAIAKENARKEKKTSHTMSTTDLTEANSSRPTSSESITPEQREKKRLDLMRRIKSFKVKSLLGKKKTTKV